MCCTVLWHFKEFFHITIKHVGLFEMKMKLKLELKLKLKLMLCNVASNLVYVL